MGRLFVVHLEGKIYSCKHCRTHLALSEDIVSKIVYFGILFIASKWRELLGESFHSRHGKAYLFNKLVLFTCIVKNVFFFDRRDDNWIAYWLLTFSVWVVDQLLVGNINIKFIFDSFQETAHENSQKYKEGKSVIERSSSRCQVLMVAINWINHEAMVVEVMQMMGQFT
ncbi:hypothetical protein Lal_00048776 [Lupinus albus]|nr:hypothetical protein Lal_00048776 [Lupinus albus]